MDTEDSVFVEINILTAALLGIHSGTIIAPSSVIFSIAFGALSNGTGVMLKKGSALLGM